MRKSLQRLYLSLAAFAVVIGAALMSTPSASAAEGEFFIQVSPSPLVATVKPGQETIMELKIRNGGSQTERLTITPRAFKVASSGSIEFQDTLPEVASWLSFSEKEFVVAPGQWFTQKLSIDVPKEAGFSYSFALIVTRQGEETQMTRGQSLKGQVAVFALLNVDRPGAKRELELETLKTSAGIYEYLPSTFTIRLKNTGNTIVQPTGNLFVQRGSNDQSPPGTLDINPGAGHILPGTTRELNVAWDDGFPVVKKDENQSPAKEYVDWNWANASKIRFGYYTAKAVVVYNDGQRDIPMVAEVGFWVIPWKIILGLLAIVGLVGFGIWSIVRQITQLSRRGKSSVRLRRK